MTCVFCGGQFFYTSWSGPAEDCDCGQCVTKDAARDMDEQEYGEARERAAAVLQEEMRLSR